MVKNIETDGFFAVIFSKVSQEEVLPHFSITKKARSVGGQPLTFREENKVLNIAGLIGEGRERWYFRVSEVVNKILPIRLAA